MEYVAAAAVVVGAFGQYQAGKAQQDMYNAQAQQAELEAKQRALQYEQKAVNTLDATLRSVASINAYSGAANLDPFSGSVNNLANYALSSGFKDLNTLNRGMEIDSNMASYQSGIYRTAGNVAAQAGMFNAIGTLGMGAMQYQAIAPSGPGPGGGTTTGGGTITSAYSPPSGPSSGVVSTPSYYGGYG
tara:strand:+ start:1483 stop:2046 length:564 start_codon:yes stop_codon:yes gene_type:complete